MLGVLSALVMYWMGYQAPAPMLPSLDAYWPRLNQSSHVVLIPPPIQESSIRRYAQLLDLSESQLKYLQSVHKDHYLVKCDDIEREHAPAYLAASTEIERQLVEKPVTYPQFNVATAAKRHVVAQIMEQLESADRFLFNEIDRILGENQRVHLKRVHMHRERERCLPFHRPILVRKAQLDLSVVLESPHYAESEILRIADLVLWEYEQALTPLRTKLDELCREAVMRVEQMEQARNIDADGKALNLNDPAVAHQVSERYKLELLELRRHPTELQKQIAKLNGEYAEKISRLMEPTVATRFLRGYQVWCYPRVFHDRADPEMRFVDCMKADSIPDDVRLVIQARYVQFRQQYESICADMCALTDARQEFGALSGLHDGWKEHNEKMARFASDRLKLCDEFMQWLSLALPPDVRQAKDRIFKGWNADVEQQRRYIERPQTVDFS